MADAGELTDLELEVVADLAGKPETMLARMLRAALPFWTDRARALAYDDFRARQAYATDIVAHKADLLLRGSKKKRQVAEVFNATAEALGLMVAAGGSAEVEAFLAGLVLDSASLA